MDKEEVSADADAPKECLVNFLMGLENCYVKIKGKQSAVDCDIKRLKEELSKVMLTNLVNGRLSCGVQSQVGQCSHTPIHLTEKELQIALTMAEEANARNKHLLKNVEDEFMAICPLLKQRIPEHKAMIEFFESHLGSSNAHLDAEGSSKPAKPLH